MLRDVLKDEWGFDGVVMSDWYAGRSTEAAGSAALDLVMPGPTGPWGDALVAGRRDGRVSEAAVDDKVLRLLALAARVGALDGVERGRAAGAPWPESEVAAELRAAAAAGFVLARNEGALLPLARADAAPRRGHRPQRRDGTDARGRQRHGLPAVHRLAAGGPARRARAGVEVRHAPGVRAHTRIAAATGRAPGRGRGPLPRPPTARCWAPSSAARRHLHLAGLLRRGRGDERGRGGRGPRAPARRRPRASTSSAPPGWGASGSRSTAGGVRRRCSSCRRAPTRSRASCARRSTASRSRSRRARRSRSSCATSRPPAARTLRVAGSAFQLNVEPPHAADDEELDARRGGSPRDGRRRGRRRRHHRGGRERGLRPRRRSRCPAARTSSSGRVAAGQPAHRRRRQRRAPRCCCRGPTRSPPCC